MISSKNFAPVDNNFICATLILWVEWFWEGNWVLGILAWKGGFWVEEVLDLRLGLFWGNES